MKYKKGQDVGLMGLVTVTVLLVITGLVIAIGADVADDSLTTDKYCTNSGTWNSSNNLCVNSTGQAFGTGFTVARNASLDGQQSLANISAKFPLLGTIVIVGVILAALAGFLLFRTLG